MGESTPATAPSLSDAERIARLQRSIDQAREQLRDLRAKLEEPESEYAKAEAEFLELDGQLQEKKTALEKLQETGDEEPSTKARDELKPLAEKHCLAKERFELAIQEHKALQEQIATLEQKLARDTEALGKLKGRLGSPASQVAGNGRVGLPSSATPSLTEPAKTQAPTVQGGVEPPPSPPAAPLTAVPPAEAREAGAPTDPPSPEIVKPPAAPPSKELIEAREAATQKKEEAAQAQEEVRSISERIEALRKGIALEQKLLETARQRADNARQTEQALQKELQQKRGAGAPQGELYELWNKISESRTRLAAADREIRESTDRVNRLQVELTGLQGEQIAALQEAEQKDKEAVVAQKQVEKLENPLSVANLWRWLITRGPRVLGILLGLLMLLWAVRLAEGRIVRLLTGRAEHGSIEDRENRAKTLVGVFHSATTLAIYAGGALMLLTEVGVNIVPLMGGAAVVGLAVAFGAQNLIRDYFYGFMILLENQYTVNDVVKIGDLSGQVELITLRLTVLRGLDGTAHFVPNGQITSVSNLTHGWSRALFDVSIAYKEDVDQVMAILMGLGKELRRDPDFRGMVLDMPEMLGVDSFADSGVVIRFLIKTRPLKQWTVKREMLRRIKHKFDELGIEIPFPHRTVYHRYEHESGHAPRLQGGDYVS